MTAKTRNTILTTKTTSTIGKTFLVGAQSNEVIFHNSKTFLFLSSEVQRPKGYQLQENFGVELHQDENIIFRVQTEEAKNLYFTIDFYALDHSKAQENAPYYAGI